jgi:tetratricopeptide (TPR) repeat protein
MKAQHRKELKTNSLAEALGEFVQGLKAPPSTTTIVFWVFVLLAVGLGIGWWFWSAQAAQTASALWLQDANATNLDELQSIADKNPGTVAARVARFQKARVQLRKGLDGMCALFEKERTEAQKQIEEAGQLYEQLAKEADHPVLVQEALLGAATAKESLGDVDGALAFYKQLADHKPESPVTKQAAEHVKKLEENAAAVKEFYAQFKDLNSPFALPPPPPSPTPVP